MMKRRAITGVACVGLLFFLAGGIDARVPSKKLVTSGGNRTAAVKTPPPAAPTAGATAGVAARATAGAAVGAAAGAAGATALRVLTPAALPAAVTPATPPTAVIPLTPPATAPTPATPYSYQPAGKADPFVPFIELELALKKKQEEELKTKVTVKKKSLPVSPLQQAEIGQFRLVGIAGDDQRRTAMVEDGVAKKYYPLYVGTYIGLNGGRVVSILPDRVIVEERLQDETKKVKKAEIRRIPLMLHKEEEGKP